MSRGSGRPAPKNAFSVHLCCALPVCPVAVWRGRVMLTVAAVPGSTPWFHIMDQETFEALIGKAIDSLPPEFQSKLENVDIVVQDWPTRTQLRQARLGNPRQLLGLYEGVPQTRRGRSYGMVLPDKISIFRRPIEAQCRSEGEIEARIGEVVRHELAHHFGMDERTLRRIERRRR